MLISDIEKILDWRCIISLQQDVNFHISSPDPDHLDLAYIFEDGEKASFLTFFTKNQLAEHDPVILRAAKAVERDDYMVVARDLRKSGDFAIIREFLSIPTMILTYTYVSNRNLYADFRFHNSVGSEVSTILRKHMSSSDSISVEYFGPSGGLFSILREINRKIPLSVLVADVRMSQEEVINVGIPEEGFIAELEDKISRDQKYRLLLYGQDAHKGKDEEIPVSGSKYGPIRESCSSHPLLALLRQRFNEENIPRLTVFLQSLEGTLRITVVLPNQWVRNYIKVVALFTEHHKTSMIDLKIRAPFDGKTLDFF